MEEAVSRDAPTPGELASAPSTEREWQPRVAEARHFLEGIRKHAHGADFSVRNQWMCLLCVAYGAEARHLL